MTGNAKSSLLQTSLHKQTKLWLVHVAFISFYRTSCYAVKEKEDATCMKGFLLFVLLNHLFVCFGICHKNLINFFLT